MRRKSQSLAVIVVVFVAGGLVACAAPRWGPLAVVRSTGDDARTEGTLRITEECVFIESQGEIALLVWPADRTAWDPVARRVSFRRSNGQLVAMQSGAAVALGGGGSSAARDSHVDWIASPAPSCLTRGRWFVSDVL